MTYGRLDIGCFSSALNFILADEATVLAFANHCHLSADLPLRARQVLSGDESCPAPWQRQPSWPLPFAVCREQFCHGPHERLSGEADEQSFRGASVFNLA